MMRPIVRRVVGYAQALGLDMIEGDYEDTGQLELNFQYDVCDRTCDNLVTYRQVCAQVAREFGVIASFMPKPTVGAMANGCHHNLSLWRGEENVFADPADPTLHVTDTARHAIAGILAHAPGMLAVCAPTVNSYAALLGRRPVRARRRQLGLRQPHLRDPRVGLRAARVQAAGRRP